MDKYVIRQEGFPSVKGSDALFTVANGHFAINGVSDELYDNELPGCYAAGVYDKGESAVKEMVNLPFPFGMRIYVNREPFDLRDCEVLSHTRELDMKTGCYKRSYIAEDKQGRRLRYESVRFASMAERSAAASKTTIVCENFFGVLNLESFTDVSVFNRKTNPNERSRHFTALSLPNQDSMYTECVTIDGTYTVGLAVKTSVVSSSGASPMGGYTRERDNSHMLYDEFEVSPGAVLVLERCAALCVNRGVPEDMVEVYARRRLARCVKDGFGSLLDAHTARMAELWADADVEVSGDPVSDKALRYCVYTLMCGANPDDEFASLGAGALRGEDGLGHVSWTAEAYALPFYIYTLPDRARAMLAYRYHNLPHARGEASQTGCAGARFPCESSDTGWEETPRWGIDKKGVRVRVLTGDLGFYPTGVIARAVCEYVRASGDSEFMASMGAEVVFDTARFWRSLLGRFEDSADRHINDATGPDDFHQRVDDNAFTNRLAAWNLARAARLSGSLGIYQSEAEEWEDLSGKVYVPVKDDVIEQFEGFFGLEDCLREDGGLTYAFADDPGRYQAVARADAMALLYMFSDELPRRTVVRTYDYYSKRAAYADACSAAVQALAGAKAGYIDRAYADFIKAARMCASGTGQAADAGALWCALFYGFLGVSAQDDETLAVNPRLPDNWESVRVNIKFQGRTLRLTAKRDAADIQRLDGPEIEVNVNGEIVTV